ncbi:hypothetical protein [Nitrososphaera viennensis]|uniref:Uncharacterized protein n=1 Tax=Nitrososphaera viennensis TaxID=1034015 RepID=A0A977ICQ3_9ARCH|nr:hypothetical protein [Nitrososphaera viennensis]UVS68581.1 hypothetical protein NWT39_11810 [Nitrososphaera viennensis]
MAPAQIIDARFLFAYMEEKLRCNICNEIIEMADVGQHVTGRNHAVKKKVAEFNEMNAQVGGSSSSRRNYESDTSVVNAWIRGLYVRDYLSGATS